MPGVFWIEAPGPGRLALGPCPLGGRDLETELLAYRAQDVEVVASLLESDEARALRLAAEGDLCGRMGMEFVSHPIPDHGVPASAEEAAAFARALAGRYGRGRRILVHCRAGIGRSACLAAAVLLETGLAVDDVLARLARARGFPVPETHEQLAWVRAYRPAIG